MFEIDIAIRHIRSRRRQTLFSVMAVALSVAIIIISMSMLSGFMKNVIDVTVENQAHITISPEDDKDYIYLYHGLENLIRKQDGIVGVSSFYQGDAALQHENNVEGAVLFGVNPRDEDSVLKVKKDILKGDFLSLEGPGNQIILGSILARNLDVDTGDSVTVSFPGSIPTEFKITGIIRTGTSIDETLAYANLKRVQDFYGKGDIVTKMGIRVFDIYSAELISNNIRKETDYNILSWMEQNSDILELIDTQSQFVYIFYILIFIISGFGIANILIMIVMEKVGEIGMLMAMGTSRRSILFIFLLEAAILGMAGVMIGSVLGYASSIIIASYTIPVPPEMYFGLDHLPLLIVPENFVIAGIFAMVINTIAGVYPARKASRMDPVEAIHSV